MNDRIKKFRSLEKKFFISGIITASVACIIFLIGIIMFCVGLTNFLKLAQIIEPSEAEQLLLAQNILIYSIGAGIFSFGITSILVGVALIIVSKAVWRTKARNLERLERVNDISE